MDQSNDILQLNSRYKIDLNEVKLFAGGGGGGNEKKKVARRRWAILARALKSPTGSQPSSPTDEISVRRISSFMLINTLELSSVPLPPQNAVYSDQVNKRNWFKYSINIHPIEYFLNVGHRTRTFSAEDLMGFNNTGNVCIWPSEETLSYYVCSNLAFFSKKSVLELGGGMSCLAGLYIAKYSSAKNVLVTDGNKISIDSVTTTLYCNEFSCPVESAVLKWGKNKPTTTLFDVIICADCLFFDDARSDLIECISDYLSPDGVAFVMAPQRGHTLDKFISQSEGKGFLCNKILNYNDVVWEKRMALLDNCDFDDNIHYPVLIEVTKVADYWKSQDRKYCDFCKCWIADNKPSRDFHENGRRHQENVKKRLKTITKNSARDQKEADKVSAQIRAMEAAALEAYKKDVHNNADLTSIAINKKLDSENLAFSGGSGSGISGPKKLWQEAKSDEGHTYYWNIMTNETKWEAPNEGYLSLNEQKEEENGKFQQQLKESEKHRQKEALLRIQDQKKEDEEERARLAREKMKERRVKEDTPEPVYGPIIDPGKNDPYGGWQKVETESAPVDLQLPETEYYETIVAEPEPIQKEFKEKTVESLGSGSSSFKKRKIVSGAKRNMRQRVD